MAKQKLNSPPRYVTEMPQPASYAEKRSAGQAEINAHMSGLESLGQTRTQQAELSHLGRFARRRPQTFYQFVKSKKPKRRNPLTFRAL